MLVASLVAASSLAQGPSSGVSKDAKAEALVEQPSLSHADVRGFGGGHTQPMATTELPYGIRNVLAEPALRGAPLLAPERLLVLATGGYDQAHLPCGGAAKGRRYLSGLHCEEGRCLWLVYHYLAATGAVPGQTIEKGAALGITGSDPCWRYGLVALGAYESERLRWRDLEEDEHRTLVRRSVPEGVLGLRERILHEADGAVWVPRREGSLPALPGTCLLSPSPSPSGACPGFTLHAHWHGDVVDASQGLVFPLPQAHGLLQGVDHLVPPPRADSWAVTGEVKRAVGPEVMWWDGVKLEVPVLGTGEWTEPWQLPMISPLMETGVPVSARSDHNGLDLLAYDGAVVVAAHAGTVVWQQRRRWSSRCSGGAPGYDTTVVLASCDEVGCYRTGYGHLTDSFVAPHQRVEAGQVIGVIGENSCSATVHLHFTVHRRGTERWMLVDPIGWTGEAPDPMGAYSGNPEGSFLFLDFPEGGLPATCDIVHTSDRAEVPDPLLGDTGW